MSKKHVPVTLTPPCRPEGSRPARDGVGAPAETEQGGESASVPSYAAFVQNLCADLTRYNADRLNRRKSATERGRERVLSVVQDILSENTE